MQKCMRREPRNCSCRTSHRRYASSECRPSELSDWMQCCRLYLVLLALSERVRGNCHPPEARTFFTPSICSRNTAGIPFKGLVSQALVGGAKRGAVSSHAWLAFKRFQIGDQVADVILVQHEFGHSRMAGPDTLGERLLQILDGIPLMKGSKRGAFGNGLSPDRPIAWQRAQLA